MMLHHMMRRIAALLAILSFVGVAGIMTATPAGAHVDLISTAPRDGQVLAAAPQNIVLSFDEGVDIAASTLLVFEPDGSITPGLGAPVHPAGESRDVAVSLPESMEPGTRTVVYRVLSTDGHPVQGEFRFSVGIASASASPDSLGGDDRLGLYLGVARWAAFVGLALAVGTMILLTMGWPAGAGVPTVRRLVWAGVGTLATASGVSLVLYGPYVAGRDLSGVADLDLFTLAAGTRLGTLLIVRLVLLAAVVTVLAAWLRRRARQAPQAAVPTGPDRAAAGVTLIAGTALALTWSLGTHAATGNILLTLPVDLVHMLAMSAWLGGMPALLILLLKVRDREALARVVPLFSRTATACVLALVATGFVQSWRQVGSAQALTSTAYGGWLMVKLGLVALILGLGAVARWWALPRLRASVSQVNNPTRHRRGRVDPDRAQRRETEATGASSRFGRIVAVETGMGAVVLAVTATLVSTQPASAALSSRGVDLVAAAPVLAADSVDTRIGFRLDRVPESGTIVEFTKARVAAKGPERRRGWLWLLVTPAVAGLPNEMHLTLLDSKGEPWEGVQAFVELRRASGGGRSAPHALEAIGPGHYAAPFTVPEAGAWQLGVTLKDAKGRAAVVLVPFKAGASAL